MHYDSRDAMLGDNPGMEGLVRPLKDRAITALPLLWEDRLLGVLGVSWSPPRTLDPQDLVFLDAVAGQLAQALERARLYEAEANARREAEAAARRLAFLAEASRILNASLDVNQTLARFARIAVPRLADWCAVYLLDAQGQPVNVATAHSDPERVALARRMSERWPLRLDRPGGTAEVLRTGESRLYPKFSDELLERIAEDPEHLAILRQVGLGSGMSVALRHGQQVVGAVTLANEAPRTADEADLALAQEFAARAATAVANAQAFAERARVARKLQASLLPSSLPELPWAQLSAGYLAAGEGEVGGDFYDAFAAGQGRWLLAVGDVRGKGVEAAAVTGLVGMPGSLLGVHAVPDLHEVEVPLDPGDTLVCFTDGITERRQQGKFFEDHLAETLASVAGRDAPAVVDAVQRAARDFVEAAPVDDMAILTLHVSG
ncbi:MAG: SpoIIE family protein phosphatase [Nitriliruptorales bacterium]|nr:SpoIIE family protein phosphatase [Nitriliruptorales bacterium]